jgi:hypothetical protein
MGEGERVEKVYENISKVYLSFPRDFQKSLDKIFLGNQINMDRIRIVWDYLASYEEFEIMERIEKGGLLGLILYLRLCGEVKQQFASTKEYEGHNEEAFCYGLEVEVEILKALARYLKLPSQMTVADLLSQETLLHSEEEAESYSERFLASYEDMEDIEPLQEDSDQQTEEGVKNVLTLMALLKKKVQGTETTPRNRPQKKGEAEDEED